MWVECDPTEQRRPVSMSEIGHGEQARTADPAAGRGVR